ncbi:hypothetical protein WJX84_002959 [Apatococcus fuscideae]|uniref:GST C-terminal domain-containing protein n=1 Tax=Apatococcus fuscideae TaxID=2026836 RepID=A0AAW1TH15_9CHLO
MVYIVQGRTIPGERPSKSKVPEPTAFPPISDDRSENTSEPGRYHLVVSLACPWASKAYLMRSLKGLQELISMDVVLPVRNPSTGWELLPPGQHSQPYPECSPDSSGLKAQYLDEFYLQACPDYTGRITVPLLWDKKDKTIVSNESSEILKFFAMSFQTPEAARPVPDYYPVDKRAEIDRVSRWIIDDFGKRVYMCVFAKSQEDYEAACRVVFKTMAELDAMLARSRYLVPNLQDGWAAPQPTLADWHLLPVLVRFDRVYNNLFKANLYYLSHFPNLQAYMVDLLQDPRVASTVSFKHIRDGYWASFPTANPKHRVPLQHDLSLPLADFSRTSMGLPEASVEGPEAIPHSGHHIDSSSLTGAFKRRESAHRHWIRADGSTPFKPEAGRYHIYVTNNCPWCHRTSITRALLGLEDAVSMDVLFFAMDSDRGWQFKTDEPGCSVDTAAGGIQYIMELYQRESSKERTVPVLYDKKLQKIVSNESTDIVRMMITEMREFHRAGAPQLFPASQADAIEEINDWVYDSVSNGAYKAGFANSQAAYEVAYEHFFEAVDRLELLLTRNKFLVGNQVTEADIKLFPTIYRLDPVYHLRFLLNKLLISESRPHLQRWLLDMLALEGVQACSNLDHCKKGYFGRTGNNLVPLGPALGW